MLHSAVGNARVVQRASTSRLAHLRVVQTHPRLGKLGHSHANDEGPARHRYVALLILPDSTPPLHQPAVGPRLTARSGLCTARSPPLHDLRPSGLRRQAGPVLLRAAERYYVCTRFAYALRCAALRAAHSALCSSSASGCVVVCFFERLVCRLLVCVGVRRMSIEGGQPPKQRKPRVKGWPSSPLSPPTFSCSVDDG